MKLRPIGFWLTIAAVVVLIGSAIHGVIAGEPREEDEGLAIGQAPAGQRIRVEVLNAAGVSGLARTVTTQLRAAGFDVVHYGNAGSLARDSTTILDRSGNELAIAALSEALDLHRIETAIDTSLYLEASLVLGKDWGR